MFPVIGFWFNVFDCFDCPVSYRQYIAPIYNTSMQNVSMDGKEKIKSQTEGKKIFLKKCQARYKD